MQSEEINELATALSKAQGEFTAVPKGDENPFFKSKYAGLPDVVKVAAPILSQNGLAISQFICQSELGEDLLKTYLLHSSGQFIEHSMRMHLGKLDSQGMGSATTYARRYSYMSVLGLVADEDDDGQGAQNASGPSPSNGSRSQAPGQGRSSAPANRRGSQGAAPSRPSQSSAKNERDKILLIKSRITYDELTTNAKGDLDAIVLKIVKENEKRFVEVFNTAGPLNIREHALELLPGRAIDRDIEEIRGHRIELEQGPV